MGAFAEIQRVLRWFGEPERGVHIIHGADSGNGWEDPRHRTTCSISRRVKLVLRLPREKVEPAQALTGEILNLGGHQHVGWKSKPRNLGTTNFLYSRYVTGPQNAGEEEFLEWAVQELAALGVNFKNPVW